MQWVSASTSSGSTLGNMPTRSWLRPSLRYDSVSTMPLARNALQTAASATTDGSRSMVPTTVLRSSGLTTYGDAYSDADAHWYSVSAEREDRLTHHPSPPFSNIQPTWSANSHSVASA